MSKTTENLKEAFAGESQARNKYTFFGWHDGGQRKLHLAVPFCRIPHYALFACG